MALDGQTDSLSQRNLHHWPTLRAWSVFHNRARSRESPPPPSSSPSSSSFSSHRSLSRSRSLRNCTGEARNSNQNHYQNQTAPQTLSSSARGGHGRHDRTRKGTAGGGEFSTSSSSSATSSSARREDPQPRAREGIRRRENALSTLPSRTTNEHGGRRRASQRVLDTYENVSGSRANRPSPTIAHHHHHHQHHDHHHHHYHYHHLYHQSSRQSNVYEDQDVSISTTSSGVDHSVWSGRRSTDQRHAALNHSSSSFSNAINVANNVRDIAIEARNRLDERLRAVVPLMNHRHSNAGVSANFLEEFSMLFDDDDDAWSDDEMWDLGIQDWLAVWGYGEGWHSDSLSSDQVSVSQGLSKSAIKSLRKEVYVPKSSRRDKEVGKTSLDQEDCSVCLEQFSPGQLLVNLPCQHRFHPDCLTPWLETHGQCPYCRSKVWENPSDSEALSSSSNGLTSWMGTLNARFTRLATR